MLADLGAEVIKIDIRLTPLDTITRTLNRLQNHKVKLLAEKVETVKDFEKANKMGFTYFQGYFFSKPEKIEIRELSSVKVNLLRLLAEVTRKETTMEKLREIISVDIAISYKLMRFLNSAYFYRLQEVKTFKHAIAYLGEKELRRFVLLVVVVVVLGTAISSSLPSNKGIRASHNSTKIQAGWTDSKSSLTS